MSLSCRRQHLRILRLLLLNARSLCAQPELAGKKYSLKRANYAVPAKNDMQFFESTCPGRVLTDPDDLWPHNVDWMNTCRGDGKVLLRPRSTSEVSRLLRYCQEHRLAVVPQGGNTGLAHGSIPAFDEIVLSMQLMNKIIALDTVSGVLTCEAGCVHDTLTDYLSAHRLMLPYTLNSRGSCQIGGNVSTNAGGMRILRYGPLHGNVLGLEVVLPDGTVLDLMSSLKKDNTGYDLKQIFIGAEGTLGVVTKVAIQTVPVPSSVHVCLVGCKSFDQVIKVYQVARRRLGETISAVEVMDHGTVDVCREHLNVKSPLADPHSFYLLLETSGSSEEHDSEKMHNCLESLIDDGIVDDGILAMDEKQAQAIWAIRENPTEALRCEGYSYKYDVSVPIDKFFSLVDEVRDRVKDLPNVIRCIGFGHLAEGDVKLNVTSKTFDPEIVSCLEPFLYERVAQLSGSVSAEHGIGLFRRRYLPFCKSALAIDLMRRMKRVFDPAHVLNPYKVIDAVNE